MSKHSLKFDTKMSLQSEMSGSSRRQASPSKEEGGAETSYVHIYICSIRAVYINMYKWQTYASGEYRGGIQVVFTANRQLI